MKRTLILAVLVLVAAILGFAVLAGVARAIAQVLFFILLIAFLVALITGRRAA